MYFFDMALSSGFFENNPQPLIKNAKPDEAIAHNSNSSNIFTKVIILFLGSASTPCPTQEGTKKPELVLQQLRNF